MASLCAHGRGRACPTPGSPSQDKGTTAREGPRRSHDMHAARPPQGLRYVPTAREKAAVASLHYTWHGDGRLYGPHRALPADQSRGPPVRSAVWLLAMNSPPAWASRRPHARSRDAYHAGGALCIWLTTECTRASTSGL